jgi:hypothetical protein
MKSSIAVFLMAVLLPLGFAAAAENPAGATKNADSREKLSQVAANVREEMRTGGRFEFVKAGERATIDGKFAEMDALYAQAGSVDAMKDDAKIELFNAQEVINSILTQRDANRIVCKNEPIIGSHVRTKTCRTYREDLAKADASRKAMDDWGNLACRGGKACPKDSLDGLGANQTAAGTVMTH